MTSPITSSLTKALTYPLGASLGTVMGQGGASSPPVVPPLFETDFATYWKKAGTDQGSETALMTATGGTKSGINWIIGPAVVGAELLTNPTFDTDLSGWTAAQRSAGPATQALVSNRLQLTANGAAYPSSKQIVRLKPGHAYQIKADIQKSTGNDGYFTAQIAEKGSTTDADWGGTLFATQMGPSTTTLATKTSRFTAVQPLMEIGCLEVQLSGASVNFYDNLSVKEAAALASIDQDRPLKFTFTGTSPAALAADKVIFGTAGTFPTSNTNNYDMVEGVHRASDGHVIIRGSLATGQNAPLTFTMDLGSLALSTDFTVEVDCASPIRAAVNGGAYVYSTRGGRPGVASIQLARTVYAGSTWDGTRKYLKVEYSTRSEGRAFIFISDSIFGGTGASSVSTTSVAALLTLNDPTYPAYWISKSKGGELAADTADRMINRDPISGQIPPSYWGGRKPVWVIETGINSVTTQTGAQIAATVKSIVDALLAFDPAAQYIVVGMYVPKTSGYEAGTGNHTVITDAITREASDHGNQFFNAHVYLQTQGLTVNGLTANATELDDVNLYDRVPDRLVDLAVHSDPLHPSDYGHFALYKGLQAQMAVLGY